MMALCQMLRLIGERVRMRSRPAKFALDPAECDRRGSVCLGHDQAAMASLVEPTLRSSTQASRSRGSYRICRFTRTNLGPIPRNLQLAKVPGTRPRRSAAVVGSSKFIAISYSMAKGYQR